MARRRKRKLTSRGRALRWLTRHNGLTEQPYGANWDHRKDGIAAAIRRCGFRTPIPWCGAWAFNALHAAGVQHLGAWMASVWWIEAKARAKQACFRGWTRDPRKVLRGDLVVLFGTGKHVAVVRKVVFRRGRFVGVWTNEGNTSPGASGSQANGGGSFKRFRPASQVHGFALVNYPNR